MTFEEKLRRALVFEADGHWRGFDQIRKSITQSEIPSDREVTLMWRFADQIDDFLAGDKPSRELEEYLYTRLKNLRQQIDPLKKDLADPKINVGLRAKFAERLEAFQKEAAKIEGGLSGNPSEGFRNDLIQQSASLRQRLELIKKSKWMPSPPPSSGSEPPIAPDVPKSDDVPVAPITQTKSSVAEPLPLKPKPKLKSKSKEDEPQSMADLVKILQGGRGTVPDKPSWQPEKDPDSFVGSSWQTSLEERMPQGYVRKIAGLVNEDKSLPTMKQLREA